MSAVYTGLALPQEQTMWQHVTPALCALVRSCEAQLPDDLSRGTALEGSCRVGILCCRACLQHDAAVLIIQADQGSMNIEHCRAVWRMPTWLIASKSQPGLTTAHATNTSHTCFCLSSRQQNHVAVLEHKFVVSLSKPTKAYSN